MEGFSRKLDLGGYLCSTPPSQTNVVPARAITSTGFVYGLGLRQCGLPVDLSSTIYESATCNVFQSNDERSRKVVLGLFKEVLDQEETDALLYENQEAIFSKCNDHSFVSCRRCRPDVMLTTRNNPGLPVLLIEILSANDSRDQLALKLIGLSAFLSELGKGNADVPAQVYGLNLPGYGTNKFCVERVSVLWNSTHLYFQVTFEPLIIKNTDELKTELKNLMEKSTNVWNFVAKVNSVEETIFSHVYRLGKSQLEDLNRRLGGMPGTHLFQIPSREALVFVRLDSISKLPTLYFKSSADLGRTVGFLVSENHNGAVAKCLVLPEEKICIGTRRFFAFKAHDSIRSNELLDYLPAIVACLDCLHSANVAHCDVRLENMVKHQDGVKFVDLERASVSCEHTRFSADSVWYPMALTGEELDWYQLGVSLLRYGRLHLEEYVEKANSFGDTPVESVLKALLVHRVKPNQNELDYFRASYPDWLANEVMQSTD